MKGHVSICPAVLKWLGQEASMDQKPWYSESTVIIRYSISVFEPLVELWLITVACNEDDRMQLQVGTDRHGMWDAKVADAVAHQ